MPRLLDGLSLSSFAAVLTPRKTLIVRTFFFLPSQRFCRLYCCQSLSWYVCPTAGSGAQLSFQYLPCRSGGDVAHNSRFSHLVFSHSFLSFFFVSHSFYVGSKRVIWDSQASPALCPTSLLSSLMPLLLPLPLSFTSFPPPFGKSLRPY